MVFSAHLNFMEFILFACIQFSRQTETVLFFHLLMNSFSLYFILHTMFVQVHYTALPYQNQDLSLYLFCEGDCNLPLPHQSADLFSHGTSASLYSHLPHIGTTLGCSFKHAFLGQIGAPSLSVPFLSLFPPQFSCFFMTSYFIASEGSAEQCL